MDGEMIMNLLSNFAFPIVAFLICVYGLKYSYDKSMAMNEKQLDRITTLSESINNNTVVLTHLVEKVDDLKNE